MFYDRFIELCKDRGIKPTPLVVGMGLSSSNVSQWKKGSTPRPAVLRQIAEYFEVPISYFLMDEEDEKKPALKENELSEEVKELIRRYDKASPELRAAVLAVLKSGESVATTPGGGKEGQ